MTDQSSEAYTLWPIKKAPLAAVLIAYFRLICLWTSSYDEKYLIKNIESKTDIQQPLRFFRSHRLRLSFCRIKTVHFKFNSFKFRRYIIRQYWGFFSIKCALSQCDFQPSTKSFTHIYWFPLPLNWRFFCLSEETLWKQRFRKSLAVETYSPENVNRSFVGEEVEPEAPFETAGEELFVVNTGLVSVLVRWCKSR